MSEVEARIENAWEKHKPGVKGRLKMDWLGLEHTLRLILLAYKREVYDPDSTILLMDEALAAFTRRGHELPPKEEWDKELERRRE